MAAPLPISALEHYCYCARQAALIHVDGVWVDNEHTVRGTIGHSRADTPFSKTERGRVVQRGVTLWSESLGLTGRADAVEWWPDGSIVPVEYKIGRQQGETAAVQICAEALCLEEMFERPVAVGYVWYAATRRRVRVQVDAALRLRTAEVITATRQLFADRQLPAAPADERCRNCQLHSHCTPDLVAEPIRVDEYVEREVYACES